MPPTYIFVIDISKKSADIGFLDTIADTIRALVETDAFPGFPRTQIGVILYDFDVHFVKLNGNHPELYTTCEKMDELFIPIPLDNLIVNLEDCA